jgi:hypothetical protein
VLYFSAGTTLSDSSEVTAAGLGGVTVHSVSFVLRCSLVLLLLKALTLQSKC